MNSNKSSLVGLVLVFVIILILGGFRTASSAENMITESRTVELKGVKSVDVDIELPIGELEITGGAKNLMEADFSYNYPECKPIVKYSVENTHGKLSISQDNVKKSTKDEIQVEWELMLNNDIPLDISIESGVSECEMKLGSLNLNSLTIERGVGEITLDLRGDWKHDTHINIDSGVGEVNLKLPEDIGARASIDAGIGEIHTPGLTKSSGVYVNDAYLKSEVTIHINIDSGVGEVNLGISD